ncbi:hypothetical protein ACFYZJ_10570 [Streptomyces sp. NPDC001848]|uniref:hypothetical protein n=1 Tax=Streptomyces sp. NPDC001848 TaxID=3364618 RepID=UPI0036CB296D
MLRAHDPLCLSTAGVVGAYAVYNLAYAALSYPAGAPSGRRPRPLVFAAGLAFVAVGHLGLIHAPWLIFVVLPLYGGFAARTDGLAKPGSPPSSPTANRARPRASTRAPPEPPFSSPAAGLARGADGHVPLLASGTAALVLAAALPVLSRYRVAAR